MFASTALVYDDIRPPERVHGNPEEVSPMPSLPNTPQAVYGNKVGTTPSRVSPDDDGDDESGPATTDQQHNLHHIKDVLSLELTSPSARDGAGVEVPFDVAQIRRKAASQDDDNDEDDDRKVPRSVDPPAIERKKVLPPVHDVVVTRSFSAEEENVRVRSAVSRTPSSGPMIRPDSVKKPSGSSIERYRNLLSPAATSGNRRPWARMPSPSAAMMEAPDDEALGASTMNAPDGFADEIEAFRQTPEHTGDLTDVETMKRVLSPVHNDILPFEADTIYSEDEEDDRLEEQIETILHHERESSIQSAKDKEEPTVDQNVLGGPPALTTEPSIAKDVVKLTSVTPQSSNTRDRPWAKSPSRGAPLSKYSPAGNTLLAERNDNLPNQPSAPTPERSGKSSDMPSERTSEGDPPTIRATTYPSRAITFDGAVVRSVISPRKKAQDPVDAAQPHVNSTSARGSTIPKTSDSSAEPKSEGDPPIITATTYPSRAITFEGAVMRSVMSPRKKAQDPVDTAQPHVNAATARVDPTIPDGSRRIHVPLMSQGTVHAVPEEDEEDFDEEQDEADAERRSPEADNEKSDGGTRGSPLQPMDPSGQEPQASQALALADAQLSAPSLGKIISDATYFGSVARDSVQMAADTVNGFFYSSGSNSPSRVPQKKTQEQIALEWRRRKRLAAREAAELRKQEAAYLPDGLVTTKKPHDMSDDDSNATITVHNKRHRQDVFRRTPLPDDVSETSDSDGSQYPPPPPPYLSPPPEQGRKTAPKTKRPPSFSPSPKQQRTPLSPKKKAEPGTPLSPSDRKGVTIPPSVTMSPSDEEMDEKISDRSPTREVLIRDSDKAALRLSMEEGGDIPMQLKGNEVVKNSVRARDVHLAFRGANDDVVQRTVAPSLSIELESDGEKIDSTARGKQIGKENIGAETSTNATTKRIFAEKNDPPVENSGGKENGWRKGGGAAGIVIAGAAVASVAAVSTSDSHDDDIKEADLVGAMDSGMDHGARDLGIDQSNEATESDAPHDEIVSGTETPIEPSGKPPLNFSGGSSSFHRLGSERVAIDDTDETPRMGNATRKTVAVAAEAEYHDDDDEPDTSAQSRRSEPSVRAKVVREALEQQFASLTENDDDGDVQIHTANGMMFVSDGRDSPSMDEFLEKVDYDIMTNDENIFVDKGAAVDGNAPSGATTLPTSDSSVSSGSSVGSIAMIKTIDDAFGICKGDIVLSLLQPDFGEDTQEKINWKARIKESIWQVRRVRKENARLEAGITVDEENIDRASQKRSSLPVDVDQVRVLGGIKNIRTLEEDALEHLKNDEIDEALELHEDIIYAYMETFKKREEDRKKNVKDWPESKEDFRHYLGAALHNIGLLHSLNGDFADAESFFVRAADSKRKYFGTGHTEHISSLNKAALCHFAQDKYEKAYKGLWKVLKLLKPKCRCTTDFMQLAEALNNLGCLSFIFGETDKAASYFSETVKVQQMVLKNSLYGGPKSVAKCTSFLLSVSECNLGYVKMLSKDYRASVNSFESAMLSQQLLMKDTTDTMMRTMEHLSVAKSLAGKQEKSLKILARMLEAQIGAYGANSPQAESAIARIKLIKSENLSKLIEAVAKRHQRQGRQQAQAGKNSRILVAKKTPSKRSMGNGKKSPPNPALGTSSKKQSSASDKKAENAKKAENKLQLAKKSKKSVGFKNPFKKEKKEKERKCGPGVL